MVGVVARARYDWAQSFRSSAGPSHFNAELQGWTLGGGLTP